MHLHPTDTCSGRVKISVRVRVYINIGSQVLRIIVVKDGRELFAVGVACGHLD